MNRTFATVCLSFLAALAVPLVVVSALGFWAASPAALRMGLETLPMSAIFAALTVFVWLCGPPKPINFIEAVGRWFLVLIVSAGMGFNATALPALIDATVNHTQLSSLQNFLIAQNTIWGLLCGLAAGAVLQYRESTLKVDEPVVRRTSGLRTKG